MIFIALSPAVSAAHPVTARRRAGELREPLGELGPGRALARSELRRQLAHGQQGGARARPAGQHRRRQRTRISCCCTWLSWNSPRQSCRPLRSHDRLRRPAGRAARRRTPARTAAPCTACAGRAGSPAGELAVIAEPSRSTRREPAWSGPRPARAAGRRARGARAGRVARGARASSALRQSPTSRVEPGRAQGPAELPPLGGAAARQVGGQRLQVVRTRPPPAGRPSTAVPASTRQDPAAVWSCHRATGIRRRTAG